MPSYSLICIGLLQRGQGSPSPETTTHFFRIRFRFSLTRALTLRSLYAI